ncbi:MAG: S1 RNA-binding domain-containing protein [Planctomycetes bacterium]|nr:S1 RNA-binding domain-containing protein [Planctomycetota bacterium]
MSSTPEPSTPAPEPEGDSTTPQRRIAIGTQRPGVKPPKPAARYEYFSSPAPAATAGLQPAAVSVPPATGTPQAAPAAGSAEPAAVPQPAAAGPAQQGGAAPQRPDGRREKRGGNASKSSFADVQTVQKLVAIPNLRAGLDEDLEEDFEAALAGVAIDDLISAATTARTDAPIDPGARITGTVLSIGVDTAFIDLGEQRQGAMKLAGLEDIPAVGTVLQLSVGTRNEEDGLYDVAFANRAVSVEDWSQLQPGMIIEARVIAANKGGLECEVAGLRGFMPASLVSTWRMENLEELVGQTLESLVTDIVPAARRLVLSRRAVLERQATEARTKLLETLEVGAALDGIVRSVRDFGAFVDIGEGVEGLVHVSQLSWDRVANPADVLQPGQRVRVIVKKIDTETGKIALSARDLVESPWKRAGEKYHVGATVRGVVSRLAQFGAFVKLEPGIEGLVHVSELASRHVRSVGDVLKEGETVECRVLAVDPDEQRMSLSIKALAAVPAALSGDRATEEPVVEETAPAVKKHSGPLKGGLGKGGLGKSSPDGRTAGERFGLRW